MSPEATSPDGTPEATVLVVDDEPAILELAREALETRGLRVVVASSASEALDCVERWPGPIDLLLIDVVMPDINGPELATRLRRRHPDAKLIFTSGYGLGAAAALRQSQTDAVYLTKPFGCDQLGREVDRLLTAVGA